MKTLDLIRYLCMNSLVELVTFFDKSGEEHNFASVLPCIHHLASIDPSWYDETLWHVEKKGGSLYISIIVKSRTTLD